MTAEERAVLVEQLRQLTRHMRLYGAELTSGAAHGARLRAQAIRERLKEL